MTITWIKLVLIIGLIPLLTACSLGQTEQTEPETSRVTQPPSDLIQAETSASLFDRKALLVQIVDESILPLHQQFVTDTEALQAAAYQFQGAVTVDNLANLQSQWQTTALAWAHTEHLGFRFSMVTHNQIKKWPINDNFIEDFIADETVMPDEPFIESIGSTSKGITAIEYLIFSTELPQGEVVETLANDSHRLAYLVALTENLHRKSQELQQLWLPEGDDQRQAFIEADFSDDNLQGSINMLVNEMIAQLEHITNTRLNYPRKGVYGSPEPDSVESPYAQFSTPLMVNNLRGLQQTFNTGLADYLDFLQVDQADNRLSETINHQFDGAINSIETISPSLQASVIDDPLVVEQAYNEVKALLILFKVDMAAQLGLTLTFSDNDGD